MKCQICDLHVQWESDPRILGRLVIGCSSREELRDDMLRQCDMLVHGAPVIVHLHALVVEEGSFVRVPVSEMVPCWDCWSLQWVTLLSRRALLELQRGELHASKTS